MNRIIMYIFSQTSFGKFLDGKKTVIGAILVVVIHAVQALESLAPMFPQYPLILSTAQSISEGLKTLQPYLENLGIGLLTVGVLHKGAKAKS